MKDSLLVLAVIVVGLGAPLGFYLAFRDDRPWMYVGVPAGASCGYGDSRGVKTCVANGVVYTCVESYRNRTVTCGERRTP
jgi:hypothetical protein